MLQVDRVFKSYTTGTFTQVALDGVSLSFRDNEFVSILGPSGSGKTTLLNVIGGLDHFDGGDLIIDGVSTRKYRDRDWDAYRNNRIGFVFQSYNLIMHQTILANVELALTLSGVTPQERRGRAVAALAKVGLADHVDKRPSQLSGGQMQRVAIARALINDPEILLADEPTGALDSKTSVQVMDLLREVAQDRLVIMVTHNPELAVQYSTRIVELADGKIRSDSNPYEPTGEDMRAAKPPRLTQMSFLTALTLSFNNLMTKKGRTLMTAFAGSIGIIGIAAILSLANGVNAYIQEVEEEALSVYPLQIMSSGFDMTSMLVDNPGEDDSEEEAPKPSSKTTIHETRMITGMFSRVGKNDLASLKEYLDGDGGQISRHVQDIEYLYGITPQIFLDMEDGRVEQVNPDRTFEALGMGGSSAAMPGFSTSVFYQMPQDTKLFDYQYDTVWGRWPEEVDELVLVLGSSGNVTDFMSYAMGLRDPKELQEMVSQFADQEEIVVPDDEREYSIDDLAAVSFAVVPACDFYVYEEDFGVWTSKADDEDFVRDLLKDAQRLKIVGIMKAKEDVDATTLSRGIYYTSKLTDWLMERSASSKIVVEQLGKPTINVISGKSFDQEAQDEAPSLDFSSFFSIDESKLAGAFVMDPSAFDASAADLGGAFDLSSMADSMDLSSLAGSMDLSSLQLPTIDLSQITLPQIDPAALQLDLSGVDLSGIDVRDAMSDELKEVLDPTLTLDASTVFGGVDIQGMVDFGNIANSLNAIISGLPPYLEARGAASMDINQLSATIQEYFNLPEVQEGIRMAVEGSTYMTDDTYSRISENVRNQIASDYDDPTRLAALDEAQRALAERLMDVIGERISDTVARVLSEEVITYVTQTLVVTFQSLFSQIIGAFMQSMMEMVAAQITTTLSTQMEQAMAQLMTNMAGAIHIDEQVFAEAFSFNMDEKELSELMMSLMTTERTSLDSNLSKFGYADATKPTEIDIYPNDFKAKEEVKSALDAYNEDMRVAGDDDRVITYTDIVGALMSSVTDIVNMISYVLVAFVSISLIVSSIMIGVITYISVLERKKEIGILRSIGASKRDVSRVFNAETVIEGLVSGLMGVLITFVATFPANAIVEANFGVVRVARLPFSAACVLIGVSVALSFIAGLLPARKAAKADPVEALRSE